MKKRAYSLVSCSNEFDDVIQTIDNLTLRFAAYMRQYDFSVGYTLIEQNQWGKFGGREQVQKFRVTVPNGIMVAQTF
jgi:hypothetical protein